MSFVCDQAEGLRRLLGPDQLRVIAVCSGKSRVGQTNLVINLAIALSQQGKAVWIVDAGNGNEACAARLGLPARGELAQIVQGKAQLAQTLLRHPTGVHVLPAREGLARLGQLDLERQQQLRQAVQALPRLPDIVLLDLDAERNAQNLPACAAADHILVSISAERQAITQAYALIKQISLELGRRDLHLATTKTRDAAHARTLGDNLLAAATRYLNTPVALLGSIPLDDCVKRANKHRQAVLEAFPDAPASQAYRALGQVIAAWPMMRENNGHLDGFLQRLMISSRTMELAVRV